MVWGVCGECRFAVFEGIREPLRLRCGCLGFGLSAGMQRLWGVRLWISWEGGAVVLEHDSWTFHNFVLRMSHGVSFRVAFGDIIGGLPLGHVSEHMFWG